MLAECMEENREKRVRIHVSLKLSVKNRKHMERKMSLEVTEGIQNSGVSGSYTNLFPRPIWNCN